MQTIIHLSDLHVGRDKGVFGRVKLIFEEIAAAYPDVPVLITGDLTDSASKPQFRTTRELLDGLAQTNPILAVPGNHDYAWKGIVAKFRPDAWKNWIKYLGSPLGWGRSEVPWLEKGHTPAGFDGLGIWEHENTVFFGVDSGDPKDKAKTSCGFISDTLASALSRELVKRSDKTRIVFLHHHPFVHSTNLKLYGGEIFKKAVSGNCELLLFGHKHDYGLWRNRNAIPLTIASHRTTKLISGDCVAFTVIRYDDTVGSIMQPKQWLEVVQLAGG
ncbi:MAG: metallophosphoesterase [Thermoanaerobaculales bacterium]|nr:metallophosphoesterase [Thermoanaerobaculales bacterium]